MAEERSNQMSTINTINMAPLTAAGSPELFQRRNFINVEQNSEEWLALRLGRFTASNAADLFAKKSTKAYQDLIKRVAFERIKGKSPDDFEYKGGYLQRGHDLEPLAAEAYQQHTGELLLNGGFFTLGDWLGASPDGRHIDGVSGVEIKCLGWKAFMDYAKLPTLAPEYYWQVHFQMLVTGWESVEFFAWNTDFDIIAPVTVKRDDAVIEQLQNAIREAVYEVERWIDVLQ